MREALEHSKVTFELILKTWIITDKQRLDIQSNIDYLNEQLILTDVGVPKGTLPKDIEYLSKQSWGLFNKHYDNETSSRHTKHWNFMEGIRIALKNRK